MKSFFIFSMLFILTQSQEMDPEAPPQPRRKEVEFLAAESGVPVGGLELLGTLKNREEFQLSFQVQITDISPSVTSILHIGDGEWGPYSRLPLILVQASTTQLLVRLSTKTRRNTGCNLRTRLPVSHVDYVSVRIQTASARVKVYINEEPVCDRWIGDLAPPSTVPIYLGSPLYPPAKALVRRIRYSWTEMPTHAPSTLPTVSPSPHTLISGYPTPMLTKGPSANVVMSTDSPTIFPTPAPSPYPTPRVTAEPSVYPTPFPSSIPSASPRTESPTRVPTSSFPSSSPTQPPTCNPSAFPTANPSGRPSTTNPTANPTAAPTHGTQTPTADQTTRNPTLAVSEAPEDLTRMPTAEPTPGDPMNTPTQTGETTIKPSPYPTPTPQQTCPTTYIFLNETIQTVKRQAYLGRVPASSKYRLTFMVRTNYARDPGSGMANNLLKMRSPDPLRLLAVDVRLGKLELSLDSSLLNRERCVIDKTTLRSGNM